MGYSNSQMVSYTRISPNRTSPRNHAIDTITIHCVCGQCTVQGLGSVFAPASRKASSNYGIGADGKIGMYCEERDRSWCSSSASNDNRAVTIEVASDVSAPYAVRDAAYASLLDLCVDICQRNGKTKMVWIPDKAKALAYKPAADEMRMTVHRWFADTSCPGAYLMDRMAAIAAAVNDRLEEIDMTKEELNQLLAKQEQRLAEQYAAKLAEMVNQIQAANNQLMQQALLELHTALRTAVGVQIDRLPDVPHASVKAEVAELLDCGAIDGGTSKEVDSEDIHLPYNVLRALVMAKRYTDQQVVRLCADPAAGED